MNNLPLNYMDTLKDALLSLPATGENGFEGLIAITLQEIAGVSFRLASSGSQFGVDGKSSNDDDAICFEGKRYKDSIHRAEVLSKIAEISLRANAPDAWVLVATCAVSTQIADSARELAQQKGIFVLILDWSVIDLPLLAVALAMGGVEVEAFLERNINADHSMQDVRAALAATKQCPIFASLAGRLSQDLHVPTLGFATSLKANADWLRHAFSSRKNARLKFGQPLCPGETDTTKIQKRQALIDKLQPAFNNTPDDSVICVLGAEGHGKSWFVAQSWLELPKKPLTIFMGTDDFTAATDSINLCELLINKLIEQTGDNRASHTVGIWNRRWRRWKKERLELNGLPSLVVVIDGLNQRPNLDWGRLIDRMASELYQIGGKLIVTTRLLHFRNTIKPRLDCACDEIDVPEWTLSERDEILGTRGVKTIGLQTKVAALLRNPRLLGIALELMDKTDVRYFEELSISRLLFEHMRVSERDTPVPQSARDFARTLQDHAKQIISRHQSRQNDDLTLFDGQLAAAADGRFFQPVPSDPTRYSLQDDGLTLALGFSVIDRLVSAERNHRDLGAELNMLLEPIAALDNTAQVVLAALTVSILDAIYTAGISVTLIEGFLKLQNPDYSEMPAFSGLAKYRPDVFMQAARDICLTGDRPRNFDWISEALINASKDCIAWPKMADEVRRWLKYCSLSPDRGNMAYLRRDVKEKIQEEQELNKAKIAEKLDNLSEVEKEFLNRLHQVDGELIHLPLLAFQLLAGKSLAPFASELVAWCFSNALNSDLQTPFKEFFNLVQLNRIDWKEARLALLDASNALRGTDTSKVGKRALANILHSSGDSSDDKEASALKDSLDTGERYKGWRLIEQYCETDPCDPSSEMPENVAQTAQTYAAIDVKKLNEGTGQASESLFFEMARPGIARFKPEIAISLHRQFAANVLLRDGFPLRQGLLELRQHCALLTYDDAMTLIKKRIEIKTRDLTQILSVQDTWLVSQCCLLLAFPHISVGIQADSIFSDQDDENLMVEVMDLMDPLGEAEFEQQIVKACSENDERRQFLLLELAQYSSQSLSPQAFSKITSLLPSSSDRVRVQIFAVASQNSNEFLLQAIAKSGWNAANIKTNSDYELWYGSLALLKAASLGLLPHEETLDRISPRLYGRAALILNTAVVRQLAGRIETSIKHAAMLNDALIGPNIEFEIDSALLDEPALLKVEEPLADANDPTEAFKRFSEDDLAFEKRRERTYEKFLAFKESLTMAKAHLILDHINLKEFEALVVADESWAGRCYALFMGLHQGKLRSIHNISLLLAQAFSARHPEKAKELFERVRHSKPHVRFTFEKARIGLDQMTAWASSRNTPLDELRFERLNYAGTDHDLGQEVLAALMNNQEDLLQAYINAKIQEGAPAEIARALMVAGFSDKSVFNDKVLYAYKDYSGLIGSAYKAAKYAYERNTWARHWFSMMQKTEVATDFWRYSILFTKIVDGRFEVWAQIVGTGQRPIKQFWQSVDRNLKHRFSEWEKKRKKKLFGQDAPSRIFLGF
jgi:hypothetical protein